MLFDVNMEDFRHKAMLVVGVHVKNPPATITYGRVVLRDMVRIVLSLDDFNEFLVKAVDIQNYYTTAPVTENIRKVLGHKFGEDTGRKDILVRTLYVLKSAVAAFHNYLIDRMHHLVLLPCTDDLYPWMKPMVRPDNGFN